jgi:hypothetical protein
MLAANFEQLLGSFLYFSVGFYLEVSVFQFFFTPPDVFSGFKQVFPGK